MTDLTAGDRDTPPTADEICDEVDLQQSVLFYNIRTLHLSFSYVWIYRLQLLFLLLKTQLFP